MNVYGLIGLGFVLAAGFAALTLSTERDTDTETAPSSPPRVSVSPTSEEAAAPGRAATTLSMPVLNPAAAQRMRATAQVRKAVEETRQLMNETTAHLQAKRLDLAERSFGELKARRDSLPEFLQVQVDQLEAVVRTGSGDEPQASMKAAMMVSGGR